MFSQRLVDVIQLLLQPISNADFVVPVEIDGTVHQVYVLKRPYVDEFLQRMGELYECVLFTASLAKVGHILLQRCTGYIRDTVLFTVGLATVIVFQIAYACVNIFWIQHPKSL